MLRWSQLPRPLLTAAAILLAAGATLYSALWMYAVRHQHAPVELGFDPNFVAFSSCMQVLRVHPGSPAEKAGMRGGDDILAVNGQPLETPEPFNKVWWSSHPGDTVALTVSRPGVSEPLHLQGTFRAVRASSQEGIAVASIQQVMSSYPLSFLLVSIPVLFLRRQDAHAWLLALMFCGMIAVAPNPSAFSLPQALQPFFSVWRAMFLGFFGALFYIFFAVFPGVSPVERRLPWLKWLGLLLGVSVSIPGCRLGEIAPPAMLARLVGPPAAHWLMLSYPYGFVSLGLTSLGFNAFTACGSLVQRKSRLILWGTAVGVIPVVLEKAAIDFLGFQAPFWLDAALVINVLFFPLSFAYVLVKHRVMEFPLLLKRSVRYVLVQRGFIVLLFVMAGMMIATFTRTFSGFFAVGSNWSMAASAVFGILLVWASAPLIRRGTERIDRMFFRSAYDARTILRDLAEQTRRVSSRSQLAALLERHIREALHPKSLAGYLEEKDGRLIPEFGDVPTQLATLSPSLPVLGELARRGKPWEVPPAELRSGTEVSPLEPLAPECLVPILSRDDRLIGLLVLGERLSEEPYSSEDAGLLASVATQAGIALEGIRLAENITERMEAERRAAHEVEIAREVQSKLFPQKMPRLETLEYAGGCVQARVVGGDYYDFLDLGPGRMGIVLADISGKGIAGALLMANLQANLRSQYALALEDLPRLLESVNRLFYENTPDDRYATLFFADYADGGRTLRYVNCGHNPPLLLRADGRLERLAATATVLGMFLDWKCEVVETALTPGDTLVMYTDGVTEAANASGEEFRERRLLESIRSHANASAQAMLEGIVAAAQQFSGGIQADDLTLVVARAR